MKNVRIINELAPIGEVERGYEVQVGLIMVRELKNGLVEIIVGGHIGITPGNTLEQPNRVAYALDEMMNLYRDRGRRIA